MLSQISENHFKTPTAPSTSLQRFVAKPLIPDKAPLWDEDQPLPKVTDPIKAWILINMVCAQLGYHFDDLKANSKARSITDPRALTCAILHLKYGLTQEFVGQAFGRDRTSVIHYCKLVFSQQYLKSFKQRCRTAEHRLNRVDPGLGNLFFKKDQLKTRYHAHSIR